MTVHWLRRIAALLIPVLLVVGLSPTDLPIWPRAMAQAAEPAKIREFPRGESERLAAEVQRLTQTVTGLVAAGEDAGGLYQWHQTLTEHRTALLGMASGVKSEWDANEATMRAAGAPESALQRHRAVSAQVQERLNRTLNLLAAALAHGSSEEALPAEVGELQEQLAAWQGTAGPVWQEVLPFGPARSNAGAVPVAELGAPSALPIATDPPSSADLAQETPVDEQALVQVLNESGTSLKQIAGWVYQQVQVQWYLDRQKSPMAVLDERAGNDTDTAGLLVALLRRAEIPARYAQGQVVLASSYWPGLFGLSDQKAVADYLTGSGIPVQQYGDASLVVPHTWVEAWDQASGTWVALDAAWKSHVWPASAPAVEPAFDLHRYLRQGQGQSPLAFAIGTRQGEVARPTPVTLADGMPRMRFTVTGQGSSWSNWPLSRAGEFTLSVGGASLSLPVSDAHGQHIFVWYEPATNIDRTLVGLFSERTPSYLVNVRPVIMMDGRVVAEGSVTSVGSVTEARVNWSVGGQSETLTRQWVVGDPQSLIFLARPVRPSKLEEWQKATLRSSMRSVEDLFGLQLSYLQFDFLRETEGSAGRLAEAWRQRVVDGPRLTMASFSVAYDRLFGTPLQESDLRIAFDAARVAVKAQPSTGAPDATVLFGVALGAEASYRESQAVTGTYGFESVPTVTSLSSVTSGGDTLIWACRLNGDKELPVVDASDETKKHIAQGFDSNLLVVAPRATNEDEAYILIDPITGASGYFLNGGRNGGASPWIKKKGRDWLVDRVGDLVWSMIAPVLPADPAKRKAALRALIYGQVAGFAAGAKEEIEWIKAVPEATGFLWQMTTDKDFREQMIAQTLQQLQQLAQMAAEIRDNWDLYLHEARDSLAAYLSEEYGVALSDPLMEVWIIYYPVGWMGGMIGEILFVTLVTGAVFKLIGAIPTVQRNMTAFRLLVRNLRLVNGRTLRAILLVDKLLPDADLFGLIEKISDSRLRRLFESTLTHYFSKVDLKTLDATEAGLKMFTDIGKAVRSDQVRNEAYWAARQVWERAGLSEAEAVILRNLRPELLDDPGLRAISHAMREVVPPPVVGKRVSKVLTPEKAYDMIAGRRPKNEVFGFFTLPEYIEDARTPDQMVSRLRLDYPGGLRRSGNKELFVLEFDYNGTPVDIPRAPTLGGSASLETNAYPFTGNGWVATDDGRWVPELTFVDGHRLPSNVQLIRIAEDGTRAPFKVFDGKNWIDTP